MNTQGDSVIRFIETFLTLGGSFYGQPFELLDFQKDLLLLLSPSSSSSMGFERI